MHESVREFLGRLKLQHPDVFHGRVAEFGSFIINGTPRGLFDGQEYVGIDWRPGPGVSVISLAHAYDPGDTRFDTIVSTSMLEHDPHWDRSLRNMVRLLRPGGSMILTCAGPGFHKHELETAPSGDGHASGTYYRNLSAVEILAEINTSRFDRIVAEDDVENHDTRIFLYKKIEEAKC